MCSCFPCTPIPINPQWGVVELLDLLDVKVLIGSRGGCGEESRPTFHRITHVASVKEPIAFSMMESECELKDDDRGDFYSMLRSYFLLEEEITQIESENCDSESLKSIVYYVRKRLDVAKMCFNLTLKLEGDSSQGEPSVQMFVEQANQKEDQLRELKSIKMNWMARKFDAPKEPPVKIVKAQDGSNHASSDVVSLSPKESLVRFDVVFMDVSPSQPLPCGSTQSTLPLSQQEISTEGEEEELLNNPFLISLKEMIDNQSDHRITRPLPDSTACEKMREKELKLYEKKLGKRSQKKRLKRLEVAWGRAREAEERGNLYMDKLVKTPRSVLYENKEKEREEIDRKRREREQEEEMLREAERKRREEEETERTTRNMRMAIERNEKRIQQQMELVAARDHQERVQQQLELLSRDNYTHPPYLPRSQHFYE